MDYLHLATTGGHTMTPVTLVTKDATKDNLTDQDYKDIFTELRQNLSLDKLIGVMQSTYSKAAWSRYERGDYELTRQMCCELRRAVNLPELPATITDAVANHAHADASVWLAGDGLAKHVILVANTEELTLHVNGSVATHTDIKCYPSTKGIVSTENCLEYVETDLHGETQIGGSTAFLLKRRSLVRPVASPEQDKRRAELGLSWRDVIDAGLAALSR
jgi:hypothetical protein